MVEHPDHYIMFLIQCLILPISVPIFVCPILPWLTLSTVVLSLVSPTAQIAGTTTVFANREPSPRLLLDPMQVWPALFQLY